MHGSEPLNQPLAGEMVPPADPARPAMVLLCASVFELIANQQSACAVSSYDSTSTIAALYPSLSLERHASVNGIADQLVDGRCMAAIALRVDFDTWLTDGRRCGLSMVGGSQLGQRVLKRRTATNGSASADAALRCRSRSRPSASASVCAASHGRLRSRSRSRSRS